MPVRVDGPEDVLEIGGQGQREGGSGPGVLAPENPLVPQPARNRRTEVAQRILRIFTSFLIGQGAIQGFGALGGLYLVRHLNTSAYAQLSLATGFQAVFAVLMDLGFAGTIIPMVGPRRDDPAVIGRYLRAAAHLRSRIFMILMPVSVVAFLAVIHKQHWPVHVQVLLLLSILLALYSGGKVAYASAPLFMFSKMRDFYLPQVVASVARLAGFVVLNVFGSMSAWVVSLFSALSVTVTGRILFQRALKLVHWPEQDSPTIEREMIRYILPASPAIVFSAFQGQIQLFLISILGGSTEHIAEVAALGRIAQLFIVLATFNTIVVEPYIARISHQRLGPTFVRLVALAIAASVPVVAAGFLYPGVFLSILGPQYALLTDSLGWVILSSCMNYVAGLAWTMNRARKWLYWSGSILEVVLLIAAQAVYVVVVGVHNTHQAVMLSVYSSVVYLVAHFYVSALGFMKGEPKGELAAA